jgi:cytolysin-activating lysine-acyltransferase
MSEIATPEPPEAKMTVSQALGEIAWLMTQSATHKYLFLADLEWLVMPAMLAGQFRIFRNGEQPMGLALWAFIDAETEARFGPAGGRLRPDEWAKGDRCWLVEVIAPFGGTEAMLEDLAKGVLVGKEAKMHRGGLNGSLIVANLGGE